MHPPTSKRPPKGCTEKLGGGWDKHKPSTDLAGVTTPPTHTETPVGSSTMFGSSRGGVRGGQDQFNWEDVKTDKQRENYLGKG